MFRRLLSCLLSLVLLCSFAFARADGDVDITELVEYVPEEMTEKFTYDTDGAVIMTITCTGDFTIGGDNYHHKDIFSKELEEHGGDIDFTMANVRDILRSDQLTIVNFEGTLTDTTYVPNNKKENDFLFFEGHRQRTLIPLVPELRLSTLRTVNMHKYSKPIKYIFH